MLNSASEESAEICARFLLRIWRLWYKEKSFFWRNCVFRGRILHEGAAGWTDLRVAHVDMRVSVFCCRILHEGAAHAYMRACVRVGVVCTGVPVGVSVRAYLNCVARGVAVCMRKCVELCVRVAWVARCSVRAGVR